MTDFLSRMAARAVGVAPVVLPRPPSPLAGADEPIEAVDQVTVAQPSSPAEAGTGSPAAPRADPPSPPPAGIESSTPAVQPAILIEQGPPPAPDADAVPIARGSRNEPFESLAASAPRRDATDSSVETPAARLDEATPPAGPSVPVTAVSAAPVVPPTAFLSEAPRGVVAAATATGASEPSPVRVHIGRLEVRANLQQAAPPPRPRRQESDRPAELSLAAYLRGKRASA